LGLEVAARVVRLKTHAWSWDVVAWLAKADADGVAYTQALGEVAVVGPPGGVAALVAHGQRLGVVAGVRDA
jgi:hypothetical protein